jgi:hypothetical protein
VVSGVAAAALSIGMIAALLLMIAGVATVRKPAQRKQGWLMLAAGFVILMNVLIWTVPGPGSVQSAAP